MFNKRNATWFAVLLLLSSIAFSVPIPKQPTGYINDYAQLLTPATVQTLDAQLQQFEQQTTNQIVVAIFPSLENESLEDYTTRLEDQWQIGQKHKDNGVLMVIFVKEHQVRIEVGYGLESVITDAMAGNIIQNDIIPNFRKQDYAAGLSQAITTLMQLAKNADQPAPLKQNHTTDFTYYYIIGGFGLFFAILFFIKGYRQQQKNDTPLPVQPQQQPQQLEEENSKRRGWGMAIFYFIITILSLLARGGRGGGGNDDFRGGGGGSSGGGGASGRW